MTNYIKNLRIVYIMTLIAPLILIGIFMLTIEKGTVLMDDTINEIFQYMIPAFGLIFISLGFILFKKRLRFIKTENDNYKKMQLYRGIVVQRIAFIEGIAIFSAIAFFITINNLYILYALISLAFYIPIYPTLDKIKHDLSLDNDAIHLLELEQKSNNFWGKNPWLIIPLIAFLILINYNSFKDLVSKRAVLPNIEVNSGTIVDSIYHNDYLDWSFVIPSDYKIIPISEIDSAEQNGNNLIKNRSQNIEKPIRLLNISNGIIDLMSNLNPRVLFPNLTSEEKYFEVIDEKLQNPSDNRIHFEKQNQGSIQIDSLEFKYIEYFVIGPGGKVGLMYISRFNKDYIFDISLTYRDTQEAINLLNRLKTCELNWE